MRKQAESDAIGTICVLSQSVRSRKRGHRVERALWAGRIREEHPSGGWLVCSREQLRLSPPAPFTYVGGGNGGMRACDCTAYATQHRVSHHPWVSQFFKMREWLDNCGAGPWSESGFNWSLLQLINGKCLGPLLIFLIIKKFAGSAEISKQDVNLIMKN
jgi:hypothetical protein